MGERERESRGRERQKRSDKERERENDEKRTGGFHVQRMRERFRAYVCMYAVFSLYLSLSFSLSSLCIRA